MRDNEIQPSLLRLGAAYNVDVTSGSPCQALLKIARLVEATVTQAKADMTLLQKMADALDERLAIEGMPTCTIGNGEKAILEPADANKLDPLGHALPEIRRLIASGKKVHAVKLYKDVTGTTLVEAVQAIEQLSKGLH